MPEQGAGCVELRGDVASQVVARMSGGAVRFLRLQETTHTAACALLVVAGAADVAIPFMHRAAAAEGELIGVGGAGYCARAAGDAAREGIVAVLGSDYPFYKVSELKMKSRLLDGKFLIGKYSRAAS